MSKTSAGEEDGKSADLGEEGFGSMDGATVGQCGQLATTEIRLWGQNYVIAPTEIQRGYAVHDINRKYYPPPPGENASGAAPVVVGWCEGDEGHLQELGETCHQATGKVSEE